MFEGCHSGVVTLAIGTRRSLNTLVQVVAVVQGWEWQPHGVSTCQVKALQTK